MKQKLIYLYIALCILMFSSVNALTCFQESSNTTNQTGRDTCDYLNYTGSYVKSGDSNNFLLINYSKPTTTGTVSSVDWQVYYGSTAYNNGSVGYKLNITLPSDCVNAFTDKISLGFYSKNWESRPYCFNGTSYIALASMSNTGGASSSYVGGSIANMIDGNYATGSFFGNPTAMPERTCTANECYGAMIYEESVYWNITPCQENWTMIPNPNLCDGIIEQYQITYYDENQCGTTNNLPANDSEFVSCCVENFVKQPQSCTGNIELQVYEDYNTCNTTFTLPATNGTNQYCVVQTQQVYEQWMIPYLFLFFALLVVTVLAIVVHPLFFWMGAVLMTTMITLNIFYDLPHLFSYVELLVIFMYIGMGILIKKKD